MFRPLLAASSFALLSLLPAVALAHGGTFRGPGGAIPPLLRPPTDPTPPPPPPPTGGPPVTNPDPMPPPTNGTPVQPQPPPPITEPGGGAPSRPRKPSITQDSWVYWWAENSAEILRLKEALYRLRITGGGGLGAIGGATGDETDAMRPTEAANRSIVVPALLRAIDPARLGAPGTRTDADALGAALIALAKVTDDPSHWKTILAGVVDPATGKMEKRQPVLVREAAATALGLLRRESPQRQFDAKDYDAVRDACFAIFEDDEQLLRTRCMAMISVGLLGGMPTRRGPVTADGGAPAGTQDPAAPDATGRIVALLDRKFPSADYPVALLAALGLQAPTSASFAVLDLLEQAMLRGKWGKAAVDPVASCWATLALGRLAGSERVRPLLLALGAGSVSIDVRRSAAIALGRVGMRLDPVARRALVEDLARALASVHDAMARAFGVMSVARLLALEAQEGGADVLVAKGARAAEDLVRLADDGPYALRSYGALALGLVLRAMGDHPSEVAWAAWSEKALGALRRGFEGAGLDPRNRAAFAVGLGLAKDLPSSKTLLAAVADPQEDPELRGYAAVAVGLFGVGPKEAPAVIERAMKERKDEDLRLQCATALGLLGTSGAVDLLLSELKVAEGQVVLGQIVLALGRIGDARVLPRLVEMADDRSLPDPTRAMVIVALGVVGDLELVPTLARLATDANYRATSDAIAEVLTIL